MEKELKQFDERLDEEIAMLKAEHARRRAEFVKQLQVREQFEKQQEETLAGRCKISGTEQKGKADKCASCSLKSHCTGEHEHKEEEEEHKKAEAAAAQEKTAEAAKAEGQEKKAEKKEEGSSGCNVYGTEQAGKVDKCAGCSHKASCSSGGGSGAAKEKDETELAIESRMELVEHKVLVLSGKGGVGKSMVSSQLAYALAARGYAVGLLDVDICGPTVPKMVGRRRQPVMRGEAGGLRPVPVDISGLESPEGCEAGGSLTTMSIGFLVDDENEAVIWRGPRKIGLIQAFLRDVEWGPLDFLIVDTPPGTSDEHLSTVQLLKGAGIDGAVVVTSPQDVSVVEVGKEINFCVRMGVRCLGVVENFADFCCPLCSGVTAVWPSTSGGGRQLAKDHSVPFLGSVPLDPALARTGDEGKPIPVSSGSGKVIGTIADQVLAAVGVAPYVAAPVAL